MINFEQLTPIEIEWNDFIKEKLEFNISNCSEKKEDMKKFYDYTKGLIKFGEMDRWSFGKFKIFQEDFPKIKRTKFLAIDNTGLCHGFIFGPSDVPLEWYESKKRDPFFGFEQKYTSDKFVYFYECVQNFNNSGNKNPSLLSFRKTFLPLQRESNEFKYFSAGCDYDKAYIGPTIYQDKSRCVHLPFVELLCEKLELGNHTSFYIVPRYESDFIYFRGSRHWLSPRRDNWMVCEGKISYEKFEIVEFEIIEQGSESNK